MMIRSLLAGVLATLACAATAFAATPLPLPPQATIAAPPAGAGVPDATDRDMPAGYVEEEFLVSGTGRLFAYDAAGEAKVQAEGLPWTTRVLVRRPANARKFSGWVFVEPMHPEIGRPFAWRQARDYFGRNGDAWIGVTTTRNLILYGGLDPVGKLKAADPVRYAGVRFGADERSEGGLNWDVLAAVGRLAKEGALTRGLRVRKTMIGGWSGSGALTIFFANTFHMRERMPDGGPIFDAVLLGEPGWYPRINANTGDIMPYDIRQRPAFLDVPMISLNSSAAIEFGMPFRPRADSDAQPGRFRAYEIAGANHRGTLDPFGGDLTEKCGLPMSEFPLHHYYRLSIDHLKQWSDANRAPPPSSPIALDRYGYVQTDDAGNPVGGVRSPALETPRGRYYQTHDAPLVECRGGGRFEAMSREELQRRYRDKAGYVAQVKASVARLIAANWLLPEDGAELVRAAEASAPF